MKLPNGYGSVSKLSGRRRRPFIVRKNGKILGYTKTREEGLEMLADFNREPWDLDKKAATFSDVFELMVKNKSDSIHPHTMKNYKSKYRSCESLYNIPYAQLRLNHFTGLIESKNISNGSKNNYRKFFRAMDKVAFEYDIIDKQYTEFIPNYTVEYSERIPFSEEEIQILWDNLEIEDVDLVLILIYTGFRSGEFCKIKLEDIHDGFITGGMKSRAGRNRRVPIHHKIKPLIENRIKQSKKDTLLNYGDKSFRVRFKKVMQKLKMNHIPHECRHTLRTRLDNIGANKVSIDLILGHASQGTGERVYTHKTLDQLRETIELLD